MEMLSMSLPGMGEGGESRSWRDSGIRSRLSYALEQEGFQKDVTFVVGEPPEIISAHRLILSLSSTYFDKVILKEGRAGLISLPKACPTMFKRLLKFIYTDEIDCDNFLPFLDFAESFGFKYLGEICLESLERMGITVENVIFVLSLLKRARRRNMERKKDFGLAKLRGKCFDFIKRNADNVIQHDSFNEISQEDLGSLLESDDFMLDGGEISIFHVALKWAIYRCRTGSGGVVDLVGGETPENLKIVLGDVRFTIRYSLIPYLEFIAEVKESGLLSPQELVQVLKTFVDPNDNTLGISTNPRIINKVGVEDEFRGTKNGSPLDPRLKRKRTSNEMENGRPPAPFILPVPKFTQSPPSQAVPLFNRRSQPTTISDLNLANGSNDGIWQQNVRSCSEQFWSQTSPESKRFEQVVPVALTNEDVILKATNCKLQPLEIGSPLGLGHHSPTTSTTVASYRTPLVPPPLVTYTNALNACVSLLGQDSSPTEFILSNTTLPWSRLIKDVKPKQYNLSRIILNNVTLVDFNLGHGSRVVLPQLKTFHYSLKRDPQISELSANPTLPDKNHPYFVNTKGFLFFEKSPQTTNMWLFSKLASLGVDIRISAKGINLMTISSLEQKIILSYPPPSVGNLILENCPPGTMTLSLCCARVKRPEWIPAGNLEQINLYNVDMAGMTLMRFVNQSPRLKHVSLHEFQETPRVNPQLLLLTDFPKCRCTLKSLSLTQYNVCGPGLKTLPNLVPFSAMESLYLNCCGWNTNFSYYLREIFPNLKRFGIRWEWKDKAETVELLKHVLDMLANLESLSISLCKLDEGVNERSPYPSEMEIWIQNFLAEATRVSPDSFEQVEDDLLSQNITLTKIDGVWTRSGAVDGLAGGDVGDQMHYQTLNLDHFFDDVEMTKFLSL